MLLDKLRWKVAFHGLLVASIAALTPAGAAEDQDSGGRSAEARITKRGDIRHLPAPLKERISVLEIGRVHV